MNPVPANYDLGLPASDLAGKAEIAKGLAELLIKKVPPPLNMPDNDGDWTKSVRRELLAPLSGQEFLELKWQCYPESPDSSKGEFLVDLLWWRAGEGAVLVVESEWSPQLHEILRDFEKIAVIKSPFKLMIYSTRLRGISSSEIREAFERYLQTYKQHIEGETYVFIEFMPKERAQAFLWQAGSSGHIRDIKLTPLVPETPIVRLIN